MKKADFLRLLQGRLGSLQNPSDIDLLKLEIMLAQEVTLEQEGKLKPWFLESEEATTETEANEQRVELPEDFLSEIEESELYILIPESGRFKALDKGSYDRLHAEYINEGAGRPRAYAMTGRYYRLFPTPDGVYTLRQRYYERDVPFDTLSDDAENRWLKYAADLLMGVAGFAYATKHLQNPQLATLFSADVAGGWTRLHIETERRKHANMKYSMGVE